MFHKPLSVFFILLLLACGDQTAFAQPISKDAIRNKRVKLFKHMINHTIKTNLLQPLNEDTEGDWQDAFSTMELLSYRNKDVDSIINIAVSGIQQRSIPYQRSLLEMIYTLYPQTFPEEVKNLMLKTDDTKIFTLCAVYLFNAGSEYATLLKTETKNRLIKNNNNPLLIQLYYQLYKDKNSAVPEITGLFRKDYLPGNVLLISLQRSNRNYPGLVLVRNKNGSFAKTDSGIIVFIPQIARSISNLPGYLTNGNTPEGIFRMDGFNVSRTSFIGPTWNIQLTMPFEKRAAHFFKDQSILDSLPDIERYRKLLPKGLRDHFPLFESYYAGMAGRSEIIAHGTTVDPTYFKGKTYFPFTPMQGCLCTRESWNESTGIRMESDQQKLVDAITRAGGPDGYCIVINMDDQEAPVTLADVIPLLEAAGQEWYR
jgi:hypothetical protein